MSGKKTVKSETTTRRRMSHSDRHEQLLQTALRIVLEERADNLTLGYLATAAGVSKPIAYDHFGTRSDLLLELYRRIETERVTALREAMEQVERSAGETAVQLADAYIHCASDTTDEFHSVGAALAGNEKKAIVFQELLDNSVAVFRVLLEPHSAIDSEQLGTHCIALVGAGEALASAVARERLSPEDAIQTFARLIESSLYPGTEKGSSARPKPSG